MVKPIEEQYIERFVAVADKLMTEAQNDETIAFRVMLPPPIKDIFIQMYNHILACIEQGELQYIAASKHLMNRYDLSCFQDELDIAADKGRKTHKGREIYTKNLIENLELGDLEFEMCEIHGFFHGEKDLKDRIDYAMQETKQYDLDLIRIERAINKGLEQNIGRLYSLLPSFSKNSLSSMQKKEYIQ